MIITRTPLRISLMGGASDRPEFYEEHGPGEVISLAITQYVTTTGHWRTVEDGVRVAGRDIEEVNTCAELKHDIAREALLMAGIDYRGVEVHTIADMPGGGTGLGASSATAVGLLNAVWALKGTRCTASELAEAACRLEIDRLKQRIGKQDQYACAFGGLRRYVFNRDGTVAVARIHLGQREVSILESHILLLYTGQRGPTSSTVLADQTDWPAIGDLAGRVSQCAQAIAETDMAGLGEMLHQSWITKRALSSCVSTPYIDALYDSVLNAGAFGGKVCGAGGGGCMVFIVPPIKRHAVLRAIGPAREVPVKIDWKGSVIVCAQTHNPR